MSNGNDKEIYEALQAVNACLDDAGEQLLVDLVEKIREGLRSERRIHAGHPARVDATLRRWVEFDAAEPAPKPEEWDPEQGPNPGGPWDPDAEPPAGS